MTLPDFSPPPTARLIVRPMREADLPDLLEINLDVEVTRFLPYETWKSLDDATTWWRRMASLTSIGTGQQLVVARRDPPGKVIGSVLVFRFDARSERAELGYVLGRPYWGRGLMFEALQAVCAHAFDTLRLRRIEAEVDPANRASDALLRRLGFMQEGVLRERWAVKGGVHDVNFYGLLRREWKARPFHSA